MAMKRLQISIEPELDDALAVESVRTGRSKADLIRSYVREKLSRKRGGRDPIDDLVGAFDYEPADIDTVVYEE